MIRMDCQFTQGLANEHSGHLQFRMRLRLQGSAYVPELLRLWLRRCTHTLWLQKDSHSAQATHAGTCRAALKCEVYPLVSADRLSLPIQRFQACKRSVRLGLALDRMVPTKQTNLRKRDPISLTIGNPPKHSWIIGQPNSNHKLRFEAGHADDSLELGLQRSASAQSNHSPAGRRTSVSCSIGIVIRMRTVTWTTRSHP